MKRTITLTITLALATLALAATLASANDQTPRVDRREARQHARIHQGVQDGQLTHREAVKARHGQRHVRRMERHAKADGVVTPGERAKLDRAQNHQSRKIYRMKHNDKVRG
jgi:uncharacterized membrane protein YebE (DUF533 family)